MQTSLFAESLVSQSLAVQVVAWCLLAGVALLGLLAVVSPKKFAAFSDRSSRWVDTSRFLQKLDKPVNVDGRVLRHSRAFGIAVIAAAVLLGWVLFTYFLR